MKLKDPLLLRELCFLDGAWAPADSGATRPTTQSVPRVAVKSKNR